MTETTETTERENNMSKIAGTLRMMIDADAARMANMARIAETENAIKKLELADAWDSGLTDPAGTGCRAAKLDNLREMLKDTRKNGAGRRGY